jgi:hypothetical protein
MVERALLTFQMGEANYGTLTVAVGKFMLAEDG